MRSHEKEGKSSLSKNNSPAFIEPSGRRPGGEKKWDFLEGENWRKKGGESLFGGH